MHSDLWMLSSRRIRSLLCAALSILFWASNPAGVAEGQVSFEVLHGFALPPIGVAGDLRLGVDGNFYGTSSNGGVFDKGTVFQITTNGTLATLYSFSGGSDGSSPNSGVTQGTDGNFYGTTSSGGGYWYGTIFRLTPGGILTTLYNFTGGSDGSRPSGGLIQGTDGHFYGTTGYGGTTYHEGFPAQGTVFRFTPAGILTVLHSFYGRDGAAPIAGLIQGTDGNFYGTTAGGGTFYPDTYSDGTVFRLTPDGVFTTLCEFPGVGTGGQPRGRLIQGADGNFYGTASTGGAHSRGTVFRLTPNGVLTTLHAFTEGSDGAYPTSTLVSGMDGGLYGTVSDTVFKVNIDDGAFTTFLWFNSPGGSNPAAGLIEASDGNFYGTTSKGGPSNAGTVFQITPSATLTTLHSFTGTDGASPVAGLIEGSDGNFYGTTSTGGVSDEGTVFRLTQNGALAALHSFSGPDGANPHAGVIQANDGNLYGTTSDGGFCCGTIFRVTPDGTITTLRNITNFTDGAHPHAGLLQASDGNFYGTTWPSCLYSYCYSYGIVFRVTPSGVFSILRDFQQSDGNIPAGGLIQGNDGALYGMTSCWPNCGMIYRLTLEGDFTTLHTFTRTEGACPNGSLIQARDGNFYGTSLSCGELNGNSGTVFRMTPSGDVALMHMFSGSDGATPTGGLIEGSDGSLFGTTSAGGPNGGGVVFALRSSGTLVPLTISLAGSGSGTAAFVDSGSVCITSCSVLLASGASVTLSATATAGSLFTGWSGACSGTGPCTVSVSGEMNVTATFALVFPLAVTVAGQGSGTVTSDPAGINCGADCTELYAPDTSVTLTATADSGFVFTGWNSGGCSGSGTCTVTMTEAQAVAAVFMPSGSLVPGVLTTGLRQLGQLALDATNVYYVNSLCFDSGLNAIGWAPRSGGPSVSWRPGFNYPFGLAVDTDALYISGHGETTGVITKRPFASVLEDFAIRAYAPTMLAKDAAHLYWAEQVIASGMSIKRVPLAGGSTSIVATSPGSVLSVTVAGDMVYWADTTEGTINKAPTTGGDRTILASSQVSPYHVTVRGGHVYWTEYGSGADDGAIKSVATTGGIVTPLVTGLTRPFGILATVTDIYWTEGFQFNQAQTTYAGSLRRVSRAGGSPTTLAAGLNNPAFLVADSTHLYWTEGTLLAAYPGCFGVPQADGRIAAIPIEVAVPPAAAGTFRPTDGAFYLDYNGNGIWDGCGTDRCFYIGLNGDIPLVGDWIGSGTSKVGTFRPADGDFYLDYNGNGIWDGCVADRCLFIGLNGDIPVIGDWDGSGTSKVGTFRPTDGAFYLDYNGNGQWDGCEVDRCLYIGANGDLPVVGDWNGSGTAKVGTFRPSDGTFHLDYNGNGVWDGCDTDRCLSMGLNGDIPLVGDWNGSGTAKIGTFRPTDGAFYLDYNGNGAWDGCETDRCLYIGLNGDMPVVGDWDASGTAKVGTFRPTDGAFYLDYNGNGQWDGCSTDRCLSLGLNGDTPVVGMW